MTAINLADSPSNGDTATVNGATYTYNSSNTRWEVTAGAVSGLSTEQIQDIVGAQLVTNGSHTGISFAYDDSGDAAIDATVGTLNQNTTGSAATLTTPRNIGGVAFDGSADIIPNIVTDTTPQLGGPLDVNGQGIVTVSNGDIDLDPNGSGVVAFKGNATKGAGQFKLNCENNSHGITIKGPPHSASASYTLTLPNNDGDANQVLKTDGSGQLSWGGSGGLVKAYRYDAVLATNVSTKRIYLHQAFSSVLIDAFVSVAPQGSNATFSVKKNGTSFQTITITDGNTSSVNTNNTTAFAEGDYITIDITAVGSTTAGENLYFVLSFS